MNKINLMNFRKFPKNRRFVKKSKLYIEAQGLIDTYNIVLTGNLHNKYIFDLNDGSQNHKFCLDERCVRSWSVGSHYEDDKDVSYGAGLDGIGILDGDKKLYIRPCGDDRDGYVELYHYLIQPIAVRYEIIDITIINDHPEVPMINVDVDNDAEIQKNIDEFDTEQEMANLYESHCDSDGFIDDNEYIEQLTRTLNQFDFDTWKESYDMTKKYYIWCKDDEYLVPFSIEKFELIENGCKIRGIIPYRNATDFILSIDSTKTLNALIGTTYLEKCLIVG